MKKRVHFLAAATLITLSSLTACSNAASNRPSTDVSTDASTASQISEFSVSATEFESEDPGEPLSVSETTELYRGFARSLQRIIASKNMNDLAEFLVYPSYIGIDDGITVQNKSEFLALDPEKVFTDALIQAVQSADIDSIELVEAGFIVGDPSGRPAITIGLDAAGSMGITGINY